MEKLKMIMMGIAVSFLMMLDSTSVFSQNKKYNPFYYPELSEHADSMQVDFSAEYKRWLIPDKSQTFKDITNDILQKGYTFERSLFCTERFIYEGTDGRSLYFEDTSFDGILGDRYARIEIYINPEVERTDSLTFRVKGKSKVKKNICDFTGEIRIEHIWEQWQSEYLHEVRKVCWWTESPGKTQDSGENFLDFIEKFHGDTLFQKRRVADMISGYNSNDDETSLDDESPEKTTQYAWDRDEAISYLIFLNYERIKPEYEISFDIKSNCNAVEDIVIPQSSCFYSLGFSLIKCEWILTSLTVNEL